MAKITCALSAEQTENLFKLTYKRMKQALESGEGFSADSFMKELFEKIAKSSDVDTAAKFVQQLPSMIYAAAGTDNLIDLEMSTDDVRKLIPKFKNPETGLNFVMDKFVPKQSADSILNAVASASISENEIQESDEESEPPVERLKPYTVSTSTFMELVPVNPEEKGVLEKQSIDPNKVHIYNTLTQIRETFDQNAGNVDGNVIYQGQRLKLKAVKLSSVDEALLDKTTKAEIVQSKIVTKKGGAEYKGEKIYQAEDRVALIISNEKGEYLYFDEQGNLSSKAEGGKIVYQFMRVVRPEANNPSRLRATDIYGAVDTILSPEELYSVEARVMKISDEEYDDILRSTGSSKEQRIAELDKQQQDEFKQLKAFTDKITRSNTSETLAFTGVSLGVPTNLVVNKPTSGQIQTLPFVSKADFQNIRIVKEPRDGFEKGAYTIKINNQEFRIDRADMTADIAAKLAHAMTMSKLSNEDKYMFMSYFLNNNIADTAKRYNIYFNPATKELEFKLRPFTAYEAKKNNAKNDYEVISLTPENYQKIYDGLMEGRYYKGRKPSKLTYNEQALIDNAYYDYDMETGRLNRKASKYVDLIMSFTDTEIDLVEVKDPGFFNSYMHFSLDQEFTKEIDEAIEETKKSYTIKEKKDIIVKALESGKELTGSISKPLNAAGNETTTQWVFTDSKGSTVNFYNRNTTDKVENYTGKTARLVLLDPITGSNDVYYPSPVGVYVDGKFVGYLQENSYSKGDEVQNNLIATEEDVETGETVSRLEFAPEVTPAEEDKSYLTPEDVQSPDDDEIPDFILDRNNQLNNKVTQEEIDAAKAWWESSPLSKFIKIEHMTNIVNSNAFARFVASAKKLATPDQLGKIQINEAEKGNYVDVYHEAWHVFSQLFLTKNEKLALYSEVRNSNPKWKNLSFKQIEELIAEDFRTYALNPTAVKNMPKRNSIFRKIINFLKKLFGSKKNVNNVSEVSSVKDLYEKLYFADKNPNFLKNYNPLIDNIMWNILDRGPESLTNNKEEFLNSQDGKVVVQSMDSVLSDLIDRTARNSKNNNKAGTIAILSPKYVNKDGVSNRDLAYNYVKNQFIKKLNAFTEEAKAIGTPENEEDDARLSLLRDNIRILSSTINNWGDQSNGMIKYHMEKSTFTIVNQKVSVEDVQLNEEDEDAEALADQQDVVVNDSTVPQKEPGKRALDQMADEDTLYMLKSLFKVDSKGNRQPNRLGFDELVNFPTVWNNIIRSVGGIKNAEVMYAKLAQEAINFPELKQLIDYKLPDPSNPKNAAEMALTTGFWQTFKKSRISYIQLTWFKQNDGSYVAEVTEASNQVSGIIYKFKNKFKAADAGEFLSKTDKNNSILKLDNIVKRFAVRDKFNTKLSWEFVRALGISLDDLTIIKKELEDKPHIYGLEYLYKIVKRFNELDNDVNASKEAKDYVKQFKEDPITTLMGTIPEGILGNKEVSEKNLIERLASLQGKYGADSSNFSVLNAERKLVYEHTEDFSISMQVNAINSVDNVQKLWMTDDYQYMSYLNPNTNPFTMRSKVLNSLFVLDTQDEKFDRRRDRVLALNAVSGSQLDDNTTGANTTSLDKYGKFVQEMHTMLKGGVQEFMRHASKSASFGTHVQGGLVIGRGKGNDNHLYVDIDKFANPNEAETFAIENIFIDYISAELERIIKFKSNIDEYSKFSGYNRVIKNKEGKEIGLAGEFFTAFDNVLSENTKKELIDNIPNMDIRNSDFLHYFLDDNSTIRENITKDIIQYFNDQTAENVAFFNRNKYVDPNLMNRLNMYTEMSTSEKENLLVKAFTYNSWIHNFEMANLFYGDTTQFDHSKDEAHKRIPGATSSGDGFRSDRGAQNYVNNILNASEIDLNTGAIIKAKTYAATLDKLNGLTKSESKYDNFKYNGTLNTAILRDVDRLSKYVDDIEKGLRSDYEDRFKGSSKEQLLEQFTREERTKFKSLSKDELRKKLIDKRIDIEIDPYKKMTEADGQGYITIDAYRTLRVLADKWTSDQETLYQKAISGEEITSEEIVNFFPVYKLQHFGPLANTPLPVTAMHKFALMPLIPSAIKGSDLESLHQQMLADNIQYATFVSGSKVGNVTSDGKPDMIYEDSEQKSIIKPNERGEGSIKFTKNVIYTEYLKDVTNVPNKTKNKTIFATQLRKLILEGLYEQGGHTLQNKYADLTADYEDAVDEYTEILKLEVLNEIGYSYKDGKYQGNLAKFLNVVVKELNRKEIPQHLIDYIGVTDNGNVTSDMSYHLEADDMEKIMVSLITKRLVKQKVKGEALVQVASSMTNGLWKQSNNFTKATDEEIKKYMGSNNLPFYNKTKDGTSAMKVAIAMQGDFNNIFKAKDLDGNTIGIYDTETVTDKNGNPKQIKKLRFQESLDKLNDLIKNEEWLNKDNNRKLITMTAVRIPVQGLNSMEFMEVHHFLSPSATGIIIPPSEIVAKSGADYDVDKLTTFMPNITSDGKFAETLTSAEDLKRILDNAKDPEQAKRIIETQKAAVENRLIQSTRNILSVPENYANLVRPNETYLLKEIADELEEDVTDYDKFKNSHGEGPRYSGKKRVISPTRIFEVGFNIYKQDVNMGGKKGLGIVALKNAIKPIFNSLGAKMPKTYKEAIWDKKLNRYVEGDIDYDMRLKLPHNKIGNQISLSNLYDVYNIDRISDLFSHKMNGLVDVEKDSWINNIQGNIEIIPILSYLIMAGVPRQTAVYFVSQPLVRQYVERQRIMNSPYAILTGNVPEDTSVKGQAAKDVLQLSPEVIDKANRLKLIDTIENNPSDLFVISLKDESGKRGLSKEETLQVVKKIKLVDEIISIQTDSVSKSIFSKVDNSPMSTSNYYYTALAATEEAGMKASNFDLENLTDLITDNDTSSPYAVAAFTHFLEIEKQIEGLEALQRVANPDTKTFKTIEEIIQREYDLDRVSLLSKLDPDLVSKLKSESVLNKFFDNELAKDLLEPLFILRNSKAVSNYITKALQDSKAQITNKYGFGEDATTTFINDFKNSIVNYAYQNYMSNFLNDNGELVEVPEMFNDMEVTKGKAVNGAKVENGKMVIDMAVINEDFNKGKFYLNSTDENSYAKRGLKSISPADNLFPNKSQYIKFVMNREYLRSITPINAIEKNKDFKAIETIASGRGVSPEKSKLMAYETYLTQNALYNSFNRTAMLLSNEFAFSTYFFSVIKDYPYLKDRYPILNQFSEPNIASKEKVLTLNDKNLLKGELAEGYYQNLLDLADPNIIKVKERSDNERISHMFEMLPLILIHINGIGYSKYGINKALPYTDFMDKMFEATNIYNNNLTESTFDSIFSTLMNNRSIFKNFTSKVQSAPEEIVEPDIEVTQTESGGLLFGTQPTVKVTAQPTVQSGEVKEGITDLFESNPELASIGTPEQYSAWINYLTTQGKLAGTQATEILYHGSDQEFDTFDKTKRGTATGGGYFEDEAQTPIDSLNAFFFSTNKAVSEQYGLLRRVTQIENIANILGQTLFNGQRGQDIKKYSPELSEHLKEKQKVLSPDELKDYIRELYIKYDNVSRDLGTGFLNRYRNYSAMGMQIADLKNRKSEILSGTYVHNSFSEEYPNLSVQFYNVGQKNYTVNIQDDGKIIGGTFDKRNITDLSSQEFDTLMAMGDKSYSEGTQEMDALMRKAKVTPLLYRVLLNVQKPLVKDFENKTFVDQAYEAGAQYEASKLTDQAAKSGKYDSVVFKNIRDPYLSDNYGVFEPEQVYILGGKEDKAGFRNFVQGKPSAQPGEQLELFEGEPKEVLTNFYNTLTAEQKQKIGNLDDLYEEYLQRAFKYSIEEFVNDIKTCKL